MVLTKELALSEELVERIIRKKKQLLMSMGVRKKEDIEHLLAETRRDYETYKKVSELKSQGYSHSKIEKIIGLSNGSIYNWTTKKRIPYLFDKIGEFTKREMKVTEETSTDLVKLLAVLQAKKVSGNSGFCELVSNNKKVLEELLPPIFNIFTAVPELKENPKGTWRFNFISTELESYVDRNTQNNKWVPWQLLDSMDKKILYFKYFFLKKGAITISSGDGSKFSSRIVFSFKKNPELKKEFAVLLFDLGMLPRYDTTKLEICIYEDFKKIYDNGWCIEEAKKRQLTGVIKNAESNPSLKKQALMRPEEIKALVDAYKKKELTKTEVIERVKDKKINLRTLDGWLNSDLLPHSVIRYNTLAETAERIGDRNAIAYFHKKLGLEAGLSRALARVFTIDKAVNYSNLDEIRQGLQKTTDKTGVFRYLHETLKINAELSKELSVIISKEKLNAIIEGDEIFLQENKHPFLQYADIIAWKSYICGEEEKKFADAIFENIENRNGAEVKTQKYIPLNFFFNMYIPKEYFKDAERMKKEQIYCYRVIRAHPRFSQLIKLEGDNFYIMAEHEKSENFEKFDNFAGSLLNTIGRRKLRNLKDSEELTRL